MQAAPAQHGPAQLFADPFAEMINLAVLASSDVSSAEHAS
jgi:hypothetical protein